MYLFYYNLPIHNRISIRKGNRKNSHAIIIILLLSNHSNRGTYNVYFDNYKSWHHNISANRTSAGYLNGWRHHLAYTVSYKNKTNHSLSTTIVSFVLLFDKYCKRWLMENIRSAPDKVRVCKLNKEFRRAVLFFPFLLIYFIILSPFTMHILLLRWALYDLDYIVVSVIIDVYLKNIHFDLERVKPTVFMMWKRVYGTNKKGKNIFFFPRSWEWNTNK